jgi:uncharacterized protein involved in response to NO
MIVQPIPPTAPPGPALLLAPHRAMFLSGCVMLLLSFALWAAELAGRWVGAGSLGWWLPPGWGHALLTLGGMFPFFIFGFLYTAMPRWQGEGDLPPATWQPAWVLLAAGWALVVVGLWWQLAMTAGLVLVLFAWARLLAVLWRIAFRSRPDPFHARVAWFGLLGGALSLACWMVFALGGGWLFARAAIEAGVWCFLLPVFFSVCHRMVPFFTGNIVPNYTLVRPNWVLVAVLLAGLAHGVLALAGLPAWSWVVDLPAALLTGWLCVRWRPLAAQRVRILGMLHIGFAWLPVALLLMALQGIGGVLGWHGLGLAPLHLLGIGFFGSILLAMVSRVTLGHSGRPLAADCLTWALFLGLQALVVVRALADLLPAGASSLLMMVAVLGWLGIFLAWALRYLPIYLRPRADGKPG